jgi:Holliday junction resolvase RusA-like endonuclease
MTIKFIIWGDPKAKRRHRSRIAGRTGKNFVATYPDPKGVQEENFIKLVASQHKPKTLILGPVYLHIDFYLPIPQSMPKKKRLAALFRYKINRLDNVWIVGLWPTKKPDLDNLEKAIKDACNKIIWHDDSQVCAVHKYKYYSKEPRTEVYIEELPSEY